MENVIGECINKKKNLLCVGRKKCWFFCLVGKNRLLNKCLDYNINILKKYRFNLRITDNILMFHKHWHEQQHYKCSLWMWYSALIRTLSSSSFRSIYHSISSVERVTARVQNVCQLILHLLLHTYRYMYLYISFQTGACAFSVSVSVLKKKFDNRQWNETICIDVIRFGIERFKRPNERIGIPKMKWRKNLNTIKKETTQTNSR